ncbi:hypothetical protein EZV62_014114 [Acer yangbiense]|uniref:EGF-like domain-containing protein n=1 Tax=Acer yangbiense TaxID=1000413 RepID=A0A5C7HR69_9ROSI|nr:hypothetical protein EZV62_014114 [Acer yangbiense]
MILHHANLAITVIVFVFLVSSIEANHHCEQKCGVGKTPKTVPFPFGFSDGCGIRLNCSDRTESVTIGEFQVQNITADNIFVGFPAKCGRNMSSLESLHTLFSDNYAMTRNNTLLLQNCSSQLNDCVMSRGLIEQRFDLKSCNQNDSMNCYSLRNNRTGSLRFYDLNHDLNRNQCKFLFSSFAFNSRGDSGVSLEFHRLELDWWLPGNCSCSEHADCAKVELANNSSGFRCLCKKGFQGDGFAAGNGCREIASDCNASNYIAGRCGNRIGALVGGLVVGASLMAGLALFCYCIRRRTPSFRNTLSAKRLLCEAAGNSMVDFARPHSDVNLAALAIDRIGRGCIDEIVDPYLEPNRDAWTLSSIHNVAELAFRCLAFHRDMRPTMMEVAEELEHIRVSAWASNMYMASPSASCCSSSDSGSERSLSGLSTKKATVMSQRLIVPSRAADCLTKLEEVKDSSPVSVQDPWLSEQSSPSTNSLLGNVVR